LNVLKSWLRNEKGETRKAFSTHRSPQHLLSPEGIPKIRKIRFKERVEEKRSSGVSEDSPPIRTRWRNAILEPGKRIEPFSSKKRDYEVNNSSRLPSQGLVDQKH